MKAVCDALAELIRESGLSIRAIAKYANTPESTIRNILRGRTVDPRLSTVADICRACGTSIERLLGASNTTQTADFSRPKCAEYDAPCVENSAECVGNDAVKPENTQKCVENDAPAPAQTQNVYNSGRIFPDENGDEALLMCHSLANTGHSFHGDVSDMQIRHALKEDAEAEVKAAQARLERAIAAREKLKGGK